MGACSYYQLVLLLMPEEARDTGAGLPRVSFMGGTNPMDPLKFQYRGKEKACELRPQSPPQPSGSLGLDLGSPPLLVGEGGEEEGKIPSGPSAPHTLARSTHRSTDLVN
ncbi:hypothetical protein NDU88_007000 [Pleurodeles waltl]|uniref:Uncharacterized protein n=1 Tax=Pleurodeles waltl TaxID=8319 RepID=A0AAV7QMS3_PLEWA|nr:hypothetical protein NDU88_007000 [Pleurodeles waltl]